VGTWKRRSCLWAKISGVPTVKGRYEQRLGIWEAEWSEGSENVGVGEGTTPDEALVMLSKFEELFRKSMTATLWNKNFGINSDAEVFKGGCEGPCHPIAPSGTGLMPISGRAAQRGTHRARNAAAQYASLPRRSNRRAVA